MVQKKKKVKWFRKTFNNNFKKGAFPALLQVRSSNANHFICFSVTYSVLTVYHHAMLVAYASLTPALTLDIIC